MIERVVGASAAIACMLAGACTSDGGVARSPATCASPGGPVSGAADLHCGSKVTSVDPNACRPDAGASNDASGEAGGGGGASDFGPTMYGTEGDDDDCKYHVKWSSTSVCDNQDVTFTVVATYKSDGKPLAGASPYIDQFIRSDPSHPPPDAHAKTTENPPGTYTMGPIRFDEAGQWTVRFHFDADCADGQESSPHGHAAFYVDVR